MANFQANIINNLAALPQLKNRVDQMGGRLRMFEAIFIAPSSGVAPAIADKIIWGQLPLGALLWPHLGQVIYNAGTAACTINLGDSVSPARHMAATAINALGSTVPSVASQVKAAVGDITTGTFTVLNVKGIGAASVGDLIVGTGIPLASTVSIVDLPNRTITFTNALAAPSTATTPTLALTITGRPYRVSDNSANVQNAFVSTLDDATLISVVAGAQVANNQVIRVCMPFVMD